MQTLAKYWIVFCVLAISLLTRGQEASFSQLLPAHHSHFDLNSGLPDQTIRFSDVDRFGRLWMQGGRDAEANNLIFPFLFDGRNTQVLGPSQYPLPREWESHVHGKMNNGAWFGSFLKGRGSKFFVFDPATFESHVFDFGESSPHPGFLSNSVLNPSGSISILSVDEANYYLYEYSEGQLRLLLSHPRIASDDSRSSDVRLPLFAEDNYIWFGQLTFPVMRLNLGSSRVDTFASPQGDVRPLDEREPPGFFTDHTGKLCYYHYGTDDLVFEFDHMVNAFVPWAELPTGFRPKVYFQNDGKLSHVPQLCTSDQSGNLLFMLEAEDGKFGLIYSSEGVWYDYSSVMALAKLNIGGVCSHNYLEGARINTNNGIEVVTIKKPIRFEHFIQNETRSITCAGDSLIYVNVPQEKGLVEIDLSNNSASNLLLQDYGYNGGFVQSQPAIIVGELWIPNAGGIAIYDLEERSFTAFFELEYVQEIFGSSGDWFALKKSGDIVKILPQKRSIDPNFHSIPGEYGQVRGIAELDEYLVAVASNTGVWLVNLRTHEVDHLQRSNGLLDDRVQCVSALSDGRLAIGLFGAGLQLYNKEQKTFSNVQVQDGLSHGIVTGILEDNERNIWVATYDGLNLINKSGRVVANLFEEDGLSTNEFNRFSFGKFGDGRLVFGSVLGINIFNPADVAKGLVKERELQIYPTYYSFYNKQLNAQTAQEIQSVPEEIHLSPERSDFSVVFGISSYFNIEKQRFAYRFKNISPDWVSVGNNNRIDLFNLAPGDYELEIIGYDALGLRCQNPLNTKIVVGQFFYRTWWFIVLVIAPFLVFAIAWVRRSRKAKFTLINEIEKATKQIQEDNDLISHQAARLAKLDEQKSLFFTNISHEFRTPLTVIQGMLDLMHQDPEKWQIHGVKMIKRNSTRLLNLVNQILDIRKLESGGVQPNLSQSDIGAYISFVAEPFISQAQLSGVNLGVTRLTEPLIMDFDPEKMQSIISNLLSNAIRHNQQGGSIEVSAGRENDTMWLIVEDDGEGIEKEQLPLIFDRFFQAPSGSSYLGSGIGLAYVKELVELHKGKISVESERGVGTKFKIEIPITNESSPLTPDPPKAPISVADQVDFVLESLGEHDDSKPNLLIVEDNEDVVLYIMACLSSHYNIQVALDGEDGLRRSISWVPDAIISDVMMPKLDGFELCRRIKNDKRTSHIPIVLLTARVDQESKMSGIEHGADAYLHKPFDKDELMLQVQKLIELRTALRERYLAFDPDSVSIGPSLDDQFMVDIHKSVKAHLEDPEFGVAHLCEEVGISRTQLHNKLKALTGKSASHFIRSRRIDHAKHLLSHTDSSISEIAYSVGFSDPAYFTRVFNEECGQSPSEFRK